MDIVAIVLTVLTALVSLVIGVVMLYQAVIGLFGLKKYRPRPKKEERTYRFAVMSCGRNEEAVIGKLVDTLYAMDYPRDSFAVFVIADNCTDNTAAVAREHGATAYERFNKELVGKGYALKWGIDRILEDHPDAFDGFVVFDSDNKADAGFLKAVNRAFCAGAEITLGYRDTVNPYDSFVSGGNAINWYAMTRFYHQGRYNLGKSAIVGGTGFAFRRTVIPQGWQTCTITEDSEFSLRKAMEGHASVLVRDAVFYDEQPDTWEMSIRQRRRWMAGYMQEWCVLRKPMRKAVRSGIKDTFDMLMFLVTMQTIGLITVMLILSLLAMIASCIAWPAMALSIFLLWLGGMLIGCYAAPVLLSIITLLLEKKTLKGFGKAIFLYPVFLFPFAVLQALAWFSRKVDWKPVEHKANGK